jgi:hypothetical protein
MEPASVLLPVPDDTEKAALSAPSGSEDISIHDTEEEEESFSSSDEHECTEDIESDSHNPHLLPKQPPTGPASIEGLPSSEAGSVSHAPSLSDVLMASSPTDSMPRSSGIRAEHMDTISPERSITNVNTTSTQRQTTM